MCGLFWEILLWCLVDIPIEKARWRCNTDGLGSNSALVLAKNPIVCDLLEASNARWLTTAHASCQNHEELAGIFNRIEARKSLAVELLPM